MKITVRLSIILLFLGLAINGNSQSFDKGTKVVQIGLGIGSPYIGSGLSTSVPPISAIAEYAIFDKIGVGALIGYTSASQTVDYGYGNVSYDYSYIIVGARGAYHFYTTDKLDVYGGAMLAVNIASISGSATSGFSTPDAGGGIAPGIFAGGRYYFTKNIGVFSEVGYSISFINGGLAVKF